MGQETIYFMLLPLRMEEPRNREEKHVISGFCCGISDKRTLLEFYVSWNGSILLTFWDSLTA